MQISIRQAVEEDVKTLTHLRLAYMQEVGTIKDEASIDALR